VLTDVIDKMDKAIRALRVMAKELESMEKTARNVMRSANDDSVAMSMQREQAAIHLAASILAMRERVESTLRLVHGGKRIG
jgi:DNA repair ATPase RecN